MGLLDKLFNLVLTRDQRERHSRAKWEKSVSQAAQDLGLPSSPAITPIIPSATPMTPSLSSSSSSSTVSSGVASPTRSRPGTSYSTSPQRPEFRRHTSITRNPISYDCLVTIEKDTKKPSPAAPVVQPFLYPLPPLGPMEGVGKYRRSIHVSEQFMDALRRDNLAALQPLPDEDDDIEQRTGRKQWRTDSSGNRDTTTPPRGYSTSPTMETADLPEFDTTFKKDSGVGSSPPPPKRERQRQRSLPPPRQKKNKSVSPPVVIEELGNDSEYEDLPKKPVVRVQSKRRIHAPAGKRGRGGVAGAKGKVTIGLPAQRKKVGPVAAQVLGASMETLVSGEE